MLKKTTIYSIMALSLTLLPASEVMADITGGTITDEASSITVKGSDKWVSGKITNSGGTLTIAGDSVTTTDYPNYVQTGGNLVITTDSAIYGQFLLRGQGLTLADAAIISKGKVTIEQSTLGLGEKIGNTLTIGYGAAIGGDVEIDIQSGSAIVLTDNAGSDIYESASMIFNEGDTWTGTVQTTEDGVLGINGRTTAKAGAYVQDGGQVYLTGNSSFNLNNTGDYISGGSVMIGKSGSDSGNTLTVSSKISNSSGQTIDSDAIVNIRAGNTLALTNNGTALLNGQMLGKDTWSGNITVADNAVLTLSGRNADNSTADVTTATKTYNQTGGTLNLGDTNGASSLTLNTSDSKITGGYVNIKNGSALVFNNSLNTNAAVVNTDGTQGNTLTIGSGSALTANNGSNIDKNAKVNVSGTLNIPTGSTVTLNNMKSNGDYTTTATDTNTGDTWDGSINLAGGTLNLGDPDSTSYLTGVEKVTNGVNSAYNQTGGVLNLLDGTALTLIGSEASSKYNEIVGGTVNIGSDKSIGNGIEIGSGSIITSDAKVNIYEYNVLSLSGQKGTDPSVVLSNNQTSIDAGINDTWKGFIRNSESGELLLQGFDNSELADNLTAVYQQEGGILTLSSSGSDTSYLKINTDSSYISGGAVYINDGNTLHITTHTTSGEEALLGNDAIVNLRSGGKLILTGTGTAILNDNKIAAVGSDNWSGDVVVGSGADTPVLTLKNVTKDFTNAEETGTLTMNSGTVNVYGNANGGSHLTVYDVGNETFRYNGGNVNVKGYDANNLSTFTTVVTKDGEIENAAPLNLQGNAEIEYKLNGHNATISNVVPTGSGPNNTMVQSGNGTLNLNAPGADLNMGYNLRVEDGTTYVDANSMTIGTVDAGVPYGYLQIGMPGNTTETHFYTNALRNNIYGDMSLYNAWYHTTNPRSTTKVGGNLHTGSGIDMMYGKINSINVAGVHTVDNLKLKIDVDPATYRADTINAAAVVANPNSTLDLVDYKLLSQPRRDKYTFRVVNAANENYAIGAGAKKIVSQNKITWTKLGGYQMVPSAVKGAFDMVITQLNPQMFRGQVATNVIYANQLAITNQLFDRMIYSNLPYFNDDCTNKTAAANTLFSPYQYSTNDTGLWFKPYANFETIRMSYVGNVRNNAYGAMIGADFAKKKWGEWSFIPTAFIGYNGGHSTYHAVGMWHNGGQGGLMGTLTRKNFVTSLAAYGGGYHNVMNVGGYTDRNALWNVGVASKTAYNIPLFWDLVLQPTLYMAYNYVGGSDFNSNYEGYMHKIHSLNAYSVAPGLNLIWQKETFSIYALFQAMFNINSVASGQIAELDLPHMGIRDPYFEYGLGFSKFFKDRFSGYGQAVARSGSRKGVGFQLGLNVKL